MLKNIIDKYCGTKIFGSSVKNSGETAFKKINDNLSSAYKSLFFNSVTPSDILELLPDDEYYIKHLLSELNGGLELYDKYGSTKIIDVWANFLGRRKCCFIPYNFKPPTDKRFIFKKQTRQDFIDDFFENVTGLLVEPYLAWFLNTNIKCPICNKKGYIALAGNSNCNHSVSFQDAVCTNCLKNNVKTIFEFKLRNKISETRIYTGNYIAGMTMLYNKVNLFMVIFERNSGAISIGKVTRIHVRINEKFLYTIQEGVKWGNPSSTVYMKSDIITKAESPDIMFDKKKCDTIISAVLNRI
jgi:hypothetical protein